MAQAGSSVRRVVGTMVWVLPVLEQGWAALGVFEALNRVLAKRWRVGEGWEMVRAAACTTVDAMRCRTIAAVFQALSVLVLALA